jgi:Uma2 family endonuclease
MAQAGASVHPAVARGRLLRMRAVMLEAPEAYLDERRRLGHDKRDEMWEGVLHMVPPASSEHQRLEGRLYKALSTIAEARGLEAFAEAGVYAAAPRSYRVPDVVVSSPRHISERGIEGRAELVVEILSPDDESRDKLPFYAAQGIPEALVVDPGTRSVEVYVLRGDTYVLAAANAAGVTHAPILDIGLSIVDGPRLRITAAEGTFDV